MSDKSLIKQTYFRTKAVEYLKEWIGKPYLWGGDDFSGFDCNGLIHEVLQGVGLEKRGYDCKADGLYKKFKKYVVPNIYEGCLIFFINWEGEAKHVAMAVDEFFIIHASGGGRDTDSLKDAIRDNAYIKQDFLDHEKERRKAYKPVYVDPFKVIE